MRGPVVQNNKIFPCNSRLNFCSSYKMSRMALAVTSSSQLYNKIQNSFGGKSDWGQPWQKMQSVFLGFGAILTYYFLGRITDLINQQNTAHLVCFCVFANVLKVPQLCGGRSNNWITYCLHRPSASFPCEELPSQLTYRWTSSEIPIPMPCPVFLVHLFYFPLCLCA